MDHTELTKLLLLEEKLVNRPKMANAKALVDDALNKLEEGARDEAEKMLADRKAKQEAAAKAKAEADAKADAAAKADEEVAARRRYTPPAATSTADRPDGMPSPTFVMPKGS